MPCTSSPLSTILEFAELTGKAADPAAFVVIALGANLNSAYGGPAATIEAAIPYLARHSEWPAVVSPLLVTAPVDCPPGSPDFVNAVMALYLPDQSPDALLDWLQSVEREFGRRRHGIQNEPRVLDLDLIAVGLHTRDTPRLTLPHPRAHQRRFVLAPLAAIWPEYRLPGHQQTVSAQLRALDAGSGPSDT